MSRSKSYVVIGERAVDGHEPGETYTATYPPEHELYLITAGHIRPASGKSTPESATAEKE